MTTSSNAPQIKEAPSPLLPHHAAMIKASAGSDDVTAARGYRSVTKKSELKSLGFSDNQCRVPALLIPVYGVTGEIVTYQARPDDPRIIKGKALKYETPKDSQIKLDIPPLARPSLGNPTIPLFVTEGARKADAAVSKGLCCISVLGVWNWRGSNEWGGKTALAEWESIALKERKVYIVFDSDVMEKRSVKLALYRLKRFLESRGATVYLIYLPTGKGGEKVGLDDFFASGKTVDDLMKLATSEIRDDEPLIDAPYEATDKGLIWNKPTMESATGASPVQLTNFTARISKEVLRDDGVSCQRVLEIAATLNGHTVHGTVSTEKFLRMGWPIELLGGQAIVLPNREGHARTAIQTLSTDIISHTVYAHSGFREIDGQMHYLTNGGGISAKGFVEFDVDLGSILNDYQISEAPTGDEWASAMRESLKLLDLTIDPVSISALGAVWDSVLGGADYSPHLEGPTGERKSCFAALLLAHFGATFDFNNLPCNWESTANYNSEAAHAAKDALLVVDDYKPSGSQQDITRLGREADRLLRGAANKAGRGRLNSDGTPKTQRRPRALIFSTGEEVPPGTSLRARLFILSQPKGGMKLDLLTDCQRKAREGVYMRAMGGFLRWLAPQIKQLQVAAADDIAKLRNDLLPKIEGHGRTLTTVARLNRAWALWIKAATECGALDNAEVVRLWDRIEKALLETARKQSDYIESQNPAKQFIHLLKAALTSGAAHLADAKTSAVPISDQSVWGWRFSDTRFQSYEPQGSCVGWVDGNEVLLQPDAAYKVAQGMTTGEALPVSERTLWKRMDEEKLLSRSDPGRHTIKETVGGSRQRVIVLRAQLFLDCLISE